MYTLFLNDSPVINVQGRKHQYNFATDGSLPNPLDMAYATLAGCAGVYAKKACKKLEKSAEGIQILGKIVAKPENPSQVQKWVATVQFPSGWQEQEKQMVLDEIQHCAVKELIKNGQDIVFLTEEGLLS